jgi:hypothetical protein
LTTGVTVPSGGHHQNQSKNARRIKEALELCLEQEDKEEDEDQEDQWGDDHNDYSNIDLFNRSEASSRPAPYNVELKAEFLSRQQTGQLPGDPSKLKRMRSNAIAATLALITTATWKCR